MFKSIPNDAKTNFRQVGLLSIGQRGEHFLDETVDCLRRHGIPFDKLDDAEFRTRYPVFSYSSDIGGAVIDKSAGLLLAERALHAVQVKLDRVVSEISPKMRLVGISETSCIDSKLSSCSGGSSRRVRGSPSTPPPTLQNILQK